MAPDTDDSKLLDKKSTKIIQSIVGKTLYYSQSVDQTMLQAINNISRFQSNPTRETDKTARMLLDYAATYPNEIIIYKAIDMILNVYSYAAYLTMPEVRGCYAGHFYLSDWPSPSLKNQTLRETEPYTQSVKQYIMLYLMQLRMERVEPSTTGEYLSGCDQPESNWTTNNQQHPSKRTILQQKYL